MGLFDEAEKLGGQEAEKLGGENSLLDKAAQEGEQFADKETGGKYDSEIQKGGEGLEQELEKEIPNL